MTPEQRGEAMKLVQDWTLRPSADMKPSEVIAIGNKMAQLLCKVATTYPTKRAFMWVHRDNPQLTTQREPLGGDWEALYKD